jgi:hypothetical protein
MTEAFELATVRFSTDDLPEQDRVAIWREQYARNAFRIDVEPAEDTLFQSSIVSRHLPELKQVWGDLSVARATRTREFAADGNDDLALFVNCTGAAAVSAGEREVVLRERDAVLIRGDEMLTIDRFASGRSLSLWIPRS